MGEPARRKLPMVDGCRLRGQGGVAHWRSTQGGADELGWWPVAAVRGGG
jgi:hypothetical protein